MKLALRRYLPRLLLAVLTGFVTLKLADIVVGRVAHTDQRHLLRLAPEAQMRHKSNEFDYVFQTNKRGLRGPDIPFDKPPGTFRIVVLGDSFIAGYGVSDDNLLTTLLQDRIVAERGAASAASDAVAPKVEVINVGRVGTSTIRELDLYETLGRRFHPDFVILAYYLGNDLAEIVQEQTHAELKEWHPDGWARRLAYGWCPNLYLEMALVRQSRRQRREFTTRNENEIIDDVRQEARARGRDPESAAANYRALAPKLRADVASGMLSEQRIIDSCIEPDRLVRALDPDDTYFERSWGRTKTHLDRLQQAVIRDAARLVIVAIPAPFQVDRRSITFHAALGYEVRESWLASPPRTAIALEDWARQAKVPCLNLTDQFRRADKPLYFIEDVHFNAEGNAAAAEAISEFLVRKGLCP